MKEFKGDGEDKNQLLQSYLADFVDFRDDNKYIDIIPEDLVQDTLDPNYSRYRCRVGYFVAISSRAHKLVRDGIIIDQNAKDTVADFETLVKNTGERITADEINKAKKFLDFMIIYLNK
ncbi:MAG: hypothetical protein Q7S66_02605 [bacterium]|nr:hypothetical protein [bacterium]